VASSAGKNLLTRSSFFFPDAANDSHCALAIYRVFEEKALNLTPRVESEWFTFDAISGVLRDQQGFQWSPFNPLYDPGPLPTTLTADSGTQP
jgi:hypothetical protein